MMSNLARKYQYHQEPRQEELKDILIKSRKITKGEKLLFALFLSVLFVLSVKLVANQAAIYEVNRDIQRVEAKIEEQTKINEDLQARVNELSEYSRLLKEAEKLGLKMNGDRVKVVQNR
jgi:cell division protein FtsL